MAFDQEYPRIPLNGLNTVKPTSPGSFCSICCLSATECKCKFGRGGTTLTIITDQYYTWFYVEADTEEGWYWRWAKGDTRNEWQLVPFLGW